MATATAVWPAPEAGPPIDPDRDAPVLVADDERGIREAVALFLSDEGHRVISAADGEEAVRLTRQVGPKLLILDVLMPGLDGRAVLREIRRSSSVPVIFLTLPGSPRENASLLDQGGDDYLLKPFHADELAARVRAVLRRSSRAPAGPRLLRMGELQLDLERRLLLRDGAVVALGRTEWLLLRHLATNVGKVVLNSDLLRAVWGESYREDYGLLRIGISRLRRKLGASPRQPGPITTYAGVGYELDARYVEGPLAAVRDSAVR